MLLATSLIFYIIYYEMYNLIINLYSHEIEYNIIEL